MSAYKNVLTSEAWQAINDGFLGELGGHLGTSARLAVMKRALLMVSRGFWPVFPLFDERLAVALQSATPDESHEKFALQAGVRLLLGDPAIFGDYEKETFAGASEEAFRGGRV